jgi:xanthine dehydrogenase YagS FAD-binding subunit
MQSCEWIDATSVEHAAGLLAASDPRGPVVAKAGGMDVLDLMKEGILKPSRLVNLKSIDGLDTIRIGRDGSMAIGALVTLATIADAPEIVSRYPALAGAARHAATPQVRSAATIGGNLLQRPRCWYSRNRYFYEDGRDIAAAVRDGHHEYHAIFDNARTAVVHASTPATALVAYDARVELANASGRSRSVPLREFLLPPDIRRASDTVIENGEVLTAVVVPALAEGTRSAYHKQTERDSYDWPICDVAVMLTPANAVVSAATIAMGWVAPTPRLAVASQRLLVGRRMDETAAREAARAAVGDATPLSRNRYKVDVLEAVIRRTLLAAAGQRQ